MALWAKLPREAARLTYHPLLCHLLDVACVVEALWDLALTAAVRRQFAAGLGLDEESAARWLTFWAGLHDLGKAFPGFQIREQGAMIERLAAQQVLTAGFPRGNHSIQQPHHGTVTTCILQRLLAEEFGHSPELARTVAFVLGGHHGAFPEPLEVLNAEPDVAASGTWTEARRHLAHALAAAVGVSPNRPPTGPLDLATATMLAGLVSVADWIGSIESPYFPHSGQLGHPSRVDPAEYARRARHQARQALSELDWLAPPRQPPAGFAHLFPAIAQPNELQQAVSELADRLSEAPQALVVVEAPTGEGKTEAAWLLADRWAIAGSQRGIYVAMPTRATTDAIFSRVRSYLEHRFATEAARSRVPLQLLHGHASLSAQFTVLQEKSGGIPEPVVGDGVSMGARASTVVASEWFTHRKRGLLAPFGVGTVDQALLGVLRVRHVSVRLFGLAARTVVIDEVHAYDTYMTALLERLLEWLAALGASVVLLSATLPAERRQRLLQAYRRGLSGSREPATVPAVTYPRVTWVAPHGSGAIHVPASPLGRKTILVEWIAAASEEDAAGLLADQLCGALAQGGCAAVVCNTVRQAQALYRALQPFFPNIADDGLPELDLLHASFRYLDRQERERRVLTRFGKPGGTVARRDDRSTPCTRPRRAILVATQIIEQSLDLDFDLLVSQVAPIDLVLQRAGRLHRHRRAERPPGLDVPRLWLLGPDIDDEGRPHFGSGTESIYDRHLLLRTWLALRQRRQIDVPEDVEQLIADVYDERECPPGLSPSLAREWERTREELQRGLDADANEAAKRWLRPPTYHGGLWELTRDLKEEDTLDFHRSYQALTRLAEPSLTLVLLYGTPERPLLEPSDTIPLNLRAQPDLATARRLLERSVPVSGQWSVALLQRNTTVPESWQQSPLLRYARPLFLDDRGVAPLDDGRWRVRLDPDLGVVIEGREKEDAEL